MARKGERDMRSDFNFSKELVSKGYTRLSDINADVSLYIKNKGIEKVVLIVVNNYDNMISSGYGVKRLKEEALRKNELCSDDYNFLTVILDDCKNYKLMHVKDTVYINRETLKISSGSLRSIFRDTLKDIRLIVDAIEKEKTFYGSRTNDMHYYGNYSVVLTYIAAFILVALYIKLYKTADSYGFSKNMLLAGEWTKLITYMGMHGSVLHLIGNVASLLVIGKAVEKQLGSFYMGFIFLISGIAGGYASAYFTADPDIVTVGASGAICGLIAANIIGLLFVPGYRRGYALLNTLFWLASTLLIGSVTSGVDNICHIGGMIGGMFAALIIYFSKGIIHESEILEAKQHHYSKIATVKRSFGYNKERKTIYE